MKKRKANKRAPCVQKKKLTIIQFVSWPKLDIDQQ